jgi:hypothetical protein
VYVGACMIGWLVVVLNLIAGLLREETGGYLTHH